MKVKQIFLERVEALEYGYEELDIAELAEAYDVTMLSSEQDDMGWSSDD